jgi:Flp pilus assembly protein TadG
MGTKLPGGQRLRRPGSEDGATLLEFALSAFVLLSLVFGVFALSMAVYTYHFVGYAARVGTRYAIVRGSSCFGLDDCGVTSAQVQTYLQSVTFPGINPSLLTATTTWPTTGTTCAPNIIPCNNPGNLVQVAVSYQFPLIIPFVPASTLTLHSTSQMVISQ